MIDISKEQHRNRLFGAVELSWRQLKPFREVNRKLVREYVGSEYAGLENSRADAPKYEHYINLMMQTAEAYMHSLVPQRPQILLSTDYPELRAFALNFQNALNNLLKEIKAERVFRQAVMDAFFSVGIVKVFLADSGRVEIGDGLWTDPGSPYLDNVSLDNFVFDMAATSFDRVSYAGDFYRVPFDSLKDSDLYDQSVVKQLKPTSKYGADEENDRLEKISMGLTTDVDEAVPMIDLLDLWIPMNNKVYTFPVSPGGHFNTNPEPVSETDWDGPEGGPYKFLAFHEVPENIMPASPAAQLIYLSRLTNNLMRKSSRQARAARTVHVYEGSSADDARRVRDAADREWVRVNNKDGLGTYQIAGADPSNLSFMINTIELFDRMAGNLQAMAGLGPQGETATQDQMIHAAVSKREQKMMTKVLDFVAETSRDLGHLLWADKSLEIPGEIRVGDLRADMNWTPEWREGDFLDYNFDVDVYSLTYSSPQQRIQQVTQLLQGVYMPMLQLFQQQGGTIDMNELTSLYAEMMQLPRLKQIVKFGELSEFDQYRPPAEDAPEGAKMPDIPGQEKRYIHENRATGGTPEGRNHVMKQVLASMAGGQPQLQQSQMGGGSTQREGLQ